MSEENAKNEIITLFNLSYDNRNLGGMRFMAATAATMFGGEDDIVLDMVKQIKDYLPF